MVSTLQRDAPWSMGFFPYASTALQGWVKNSKPAILIRDHGRYLRLDVDQRVEKLAEWNRPVWWPLAALGAGGGLAVFFVRRSLRRRERMNARGEVLAA
jgi:hypothetical protein